jgi:hypothetical protein
MNIRLIGSDTNGRRYEKQLFDNEQWRKFRLKILNIHRQWHCVLKFAIDWLSTINLLLEMKNMKLQEPDRKQIKEQFIKTLLLKRWAGRLLVGPPSAAEL